MMKVQLQVIAVGILGFLTIARADGPSTPIPADFKMQIASFGAAKEPVYTEEVVFRSGRIYVFPSNSKEVTIIEPGRSLVEILDVGRKVQTEIPFQKLDDGMVKIKASLRAASENLEKQGGRGKILESKMTRDLFETKLEITHDPKTNHIRLKNPTVEVDADGEPEVDAPRLAMVTSALVNVARLGAYRTPNDLPPFIELESIAALTGERKLRPTSITYLYRLAGPPQKMRRTYKLIPTLTDREVEAISRVDRLREVAPSLRYDQYRVDR
jgi:hypothetical protein